MADESLIIDGDIPCSIITIGVKGCICQRMNIELRSIDKRFGQVIANDAISAVFLGGRIVGILGENGAGKSTLMKILSGYQRADQGDILLDGVRAAYHDPQAAIRAGIGMLQQDPLDVPALTVLENFIYGQPGGITLGQRSARARFLELCDRFGFALDPNAPAADLTIGQRQQLEIVRLLALGIKTLILDEPTTGISAAQKDRLFAALRNLASRDGMGVLLVSHKLEDVIALCDEVIILRSGRLVGKETMPTTIPRLVEMMFDTDLTPQPRLQVPLGADRLVIDRVRLSDGRVTIENFSLTARAGEVIGCAGLDGSGQELLLRACVGLVHPIAGHIRVDGVDRTHRPYRQALTQGIAYAAAGRLEEGLIAGLTLTEHVALIASGSGVVDWRAVHRDTAQRLKQYNVRGRPDDRIEALSGGNQQRVQLALLPAASHLLVLEQPTRGLDVDSSAWVWSQILDRRAHGTTVMFASPDLDELVAYSDRILVFFAGSVYVIDDPAAVTIDDLGRLIGGDTAGIAQKERGA